MFDSLWPHGLQQARLPCPSPTPRTYSNSCPLSQWCYPTISSSVIHFSSCLQSFPASGSFLVSQFFGQNIGASASASVLPMNIQGWFPLGLTCWSLCSPRDSQKSSPAPQFKSIYSLVLSLFYGPTLTSVHDYWKKSYCWLQYSCLENPMDRGTWRATVHEVAKSWTLLSNWVWLYGPLLAKWCLCFLIRCLGLS